MPTYHVKLRALRWSDVCLDVEANSRLEAEHAAGIRALEYDAIEAAKVVSVAKVEPETESPACD